MSYLTQYLLFFWNSLLDILTTKGMEIILTGLAAGFFGGLFAGIWTNYYSIQRLLRERRENEYDAHRTSLIQINQELTILRPLIYKNIKAIGDSLANTNKKQTRIMLRLYKLTLSTGLGLKLLNSESINKYVEISYLLESINADVEYINWYIINLIWKEYKDETLEDSFLTSYIDIISNLIKNCEIAEQKSLRAIAFLNLALSENEKQIREVYIEKGKTISYSFTDKAIDREVARVISEEERPVRKSEKIKFKIPSIDISKES